MNLHDILKKSQNAEIFSREEIIEMLTLPTNSIDTFVIMAQASQISREVSNTQAEIHAQLAVNLAPCPRDCLFCSFAVTNNIFSTSVIIDPAEASAQAQQFEEDGANAIYVMATATFDMGQFIETACEIRRSLRTDTVMIANVGDELAGKAASLVETGFQGVYHALRLREGIDTTIEPTLRFKSIRSFQDAGLKVGTCVEPIGPEHTNEELAEMILFTASLNPAFSGAARRIPIPGTALAGRGKISELRMAQIVAVTRLAMPRSVLATAPTNQAQFRLWGAPICSGQRWAPIPATSGKKPRRVEVTPYLRSGNFSRKWSGQRLRGHRASLAIKLEPRKSI